MTKEVNVVVRAMRKTESGAIFGYFDTEADVPEGWKILDTDYFITDVMETCRCTREHALRMMNIHWQR